jgi:FOG: ankyrin repeat
MKKYLWISVAAVAIAAAGSAGYYHYYYDNTGIANVFEAAEKSTPCKVEKYLRIHSPDLKKTDVNGYTLLMYAAANRDAGMVKTFLEAGAEPDAEAKDGMTPLLMAVLKQNAEAVRMLLDAGADINHINANGWSPLAFAVSNSSGPEMVQLLLDRKADVRFRVGGQIGLINLALQTKRPADVIAELVDAGANVFEVDKDGNGLIAKAVMLESEPETIKILAKNGADVNQSNLQGMTPLELALYNSRGAAMVQALVEAGARLTDNPKEILKYAVVNNKDPKVLDVLAQAKMPVRLAEDDFSLIAETVQIPHQEKMLATVLKYDNIVNQKDSKGRTPVFAAMIADQSREVLDLLAQKGANFKVADNKGITLLMQAVDNNAGRAVIEYLLDKRVDLFAKDKAGNTALDYAAANQYDAEVTLLLLERFAQDGKHQDDINRAAIAAAGNPNASLLAGFAEKGAKIDFAKQGLSLLFQAVGERGMLENVRQMLKMGADVNVTIQGKVTPLHVAAAANPDPEMARLLIQAGAQVNIQDDSGFTPLMLTALYNPRGSEVAKVLLEAKADPKIKDVTGKTYFDMLRERQARESEMQTEVPENISEVTPVPGADSGSKEK